MQGTLYDLTAHLSDIHSLLGYQGLDFFMHNQDKDNGSRSLAMLNDTCNILSYKTEYVDLKQGDGLGKYLAFNYFIDGKKIESDEYNPAAFYDVLDESAKKQNLVVLAHCGCGCWGCSSLVARVKYLSEDVVEWTVDEYRSERNPQVYIFKKDEYEKVIAQMKNEANLECFQKNERKKEYFFIKMSPDACALFYNDNNGDTDFGVVCGDDESISLPDSDETFQIDMPELSSWLSEYIDKILIPSESGQISIEKLNQTFDWKDFHKRGIKLAIAIKKLLPENVIIKYSRPFEDNSKLIDNDILIISDDIYVEDVLSKII